MDITPNVTTVVQIFNFGIAYGMIRVFLCKPVVALLQQEEGHVRQLHTAITTHTALVDTTKANLYRQEYLQHQFFINNRPALEDAILSLPTMGLEGWNQDQLPGKQEIDSLVNSLADSIVNKVLYGNK
jgi:hypothetical protein